MELPFRSKGDELLPHGAMLALRERLKTLAKPHDIATVAVYAFDRRTRMLPFIFMDKRMAPGGVRELGTAMLEMGFEKTRVVYQQWKWNFRPSEMRLDGRVPDLFLVSSMAIHGGEMDQLIRDANRIPEAHRPLILAGGPRTNYEPWLAFNTDPGTPGGADCATTGELFVFLSLMEALLEDKRQNETLRQTFLRVRDAGGLDHIPGLVYAKGRVEGVAEELIDTGVQRLLQTMDELPHPVHGYTLLEPPSRKPTLASQALPTNKVKRYAPVSSIVMTYGCKFRCPYCPIPAYNQHKDREKTPERIADEMRRIYETYGIGYFFGTDDNFLNRKERTLHIAETLAASKLSDGVTPLAKNVRWSSEVTVHDTLEVKEHLRLIRRAGARAFWLGVEDMTATFIKKGQDQDKTREAFQALTRAGIHAMPMMMHDDSQPLLSFKNARGLLNQAQLLRNAGAVSFQVLLLSPAHGTKLYNETYQSGMAYKEVGGKKVEPYLIDGNNLVASYHKRPWTRQLNILIAYMFFYNPLRFLKACVFPKNRRGWWSDALFQLIGMGGQVMNWWRSPRWMWRLWRGRIVRHTEPPQSRVPMRDPQGGEADHDLPPGPDPKKIRRRETVPYDEERKALLAKKRVPTLH